MNITKIENGRAAFAFKEVKIAVTNNNPEKVRTVIKKMPTMIQMNGLGQTLAFYFSKSNKGSEIEHKVIYDIVEKWLVQENAAYLFEASNDKVELVDRIINLNTKEYKMATAETMALLNWLRRFVEGMVSSKSIDSQNGGE